MLSWNELLDNLKGDVQDKSKNPFFGAFIVTWSIRHWELFFRVFDSDPEKISRIDVIKSYFEELPALDFWITVILSFGVIILGYLFLNLARVISNISEKILTPTIYKWTAGKGSIVLKEEYEKVLLREDKLKEKLQNEKEERRNLESQVDRLETDILKFRTSPIEESGETDMEKSEKTVSNTQNEVPDDLMLKAQSIYRKLNSQGIVKDFERTSSRILSGTPLEKHNQNISKFLSLKLIRFVNDVSPLDGTALFDLTDLGDGLLDTINYKEENNS